MEGESTSSFTDKDDVAFRSLQFSHMQTYNTLMCCKCNGTHEFQIQTIRNKKLTRDTEI